MKTFEKTIAALAFAFTLTACGTHAHAAPPTQKTTRRDGGDFLPAYLAMLQAKKFPKDTCQPADLQQLLLAPCD